MDHEEETLVVNSPTKGERLAGMDTLNWNKVSRQKYVLLTGLFVFAYVYSLVLSPKIIYKENWPWNKINSVHRSCLVSFQDCRICEILTQYRGDNYFIESIVYDLSNCLATFWSVTHFVFFAVLGFIEPLLFWTFFLIGVGFESMEYYVLDCHDWLDIGYNTLGLLTGMFLHKLLLS